jgi:hypothetical protein
MMTFSEFVASQRSDALSVVPATKSVVAPSLASPGTQDTKRAIERARRLGKAVTPADLTNAISPESQQSARDGVMKRSG